MAVLVALLVGAAAGAGLIEAAPVTVPLLALAGVGTTVALSWHVAANPRRNRDRVLQGRQTTRTAAG